eukprot:3071083-Prymnesium_polylepis.1
MASTGHARARRSRASRSSSGCRCTATWASSCRSSSACCVGARTRATRRGAAGAGQTSAEVKGLRILAAMGKGRGPQRLEHGLVGRPRA